MVKNKLYIYIFIVVTFAIITIATIVKVYDNHKEKLILVTELRIEEAARKCIIDEICNGDEKITLGSLIEQSYLESQVHPLTKEYLSSDIQIECIDYVCNTNIN